MKRITKHNAVNLILILVNIVLNLVQITTNVFGMIEVYFCFMTLLTSVGISLFFKFLIFKSDSSLWISITLVLGAITFCILYCLNLNFGKFLVTFLISPIIASLFVGLIFKDALQLKVVMYLCLMGISLYLFNFRNVQWYFCVLIFIAGTIFLVFVFKFLPKILSSINKRSKYG